MKCIVLFLTIITLGLYLPPAQNIGEKATNFSVADIINNDGRNSLDAHRGDIVCLVYFSTKSAECRDMIPRLNQLHNQFAAQGFTIIGVSTESLSVLYRYALHRLAFDFKVFANTSHQYPGTILPRSYVIGADGTFLWQGKPTALTEATINKFIEQRRVFFKTEFSEAPEDAIYRMLTGETEFAFRLAVEASSKEIMLTKKQAATKLLTYIKPILDSKMKHADEMFAQRDYLLAQGYYLKFKNACSKTVFAQKAKDKLRKYRRREIRREMRALRSLDRILLLYRKESGYRDFAAGAQKLEYFAAHKTNEDTKAAEKADFWAHILATPWSE